MKKNLFLIITIILLIILSILITYPKIDKSNNENKDEYEEIKLNDNTIINLKSYDFDNGRFSLKIPTKFNLMNEEIRNEKYPNDKRPLIVYTNEDNNIDIAISITDTTVNDIEEYTNSVKEAFKELYGEISINIYKKNKSKIGEISFITKPQDEELYNHMLFFEIDGILRIITFNCPKKVINEWENISNIIMKSLIINE